MFDLSTTAQRLRIVKQAYQEFLTRWAVERAMNSPDVADRIFRDIDTADCDPFGRSRFGLNPRRGNADN